MRASRRFVGSVWTHPTLLVTGESLEIVAHGEDILAQVLKCLKDVFLVGDKIIPFRSSYCDLLNPQFANPD